jgi:hypothetical protein
MRPSPPRRRTLRDLDSPDPRGAEPYSIQAQTTRLPEQESVVLVDEKR